MTWAAIHGRLYEQAGAAVTGERGEMVGGYSALHVAAANGSTAGA
jgi:hypothetical protein